MYQRILLPLDGSTRAEAIVPHVRSLAEKYGSQVILLQVVSPPLLLERDEVTDGGRMKEDQKAKKNAVLAYLEAVAQEFGPAPGPLKICVEAESVVQAIFEVATREKADLVAMASHGWGGSRRTFYGSVASGTINKADKPLLLIRSRDEGESD
jgi:nucleotide-binding universal stress UspA family protein